MKKMIQKFSLLSFVFVVTAVGAFAQSDFGTEVEIPFAFNVGNKSYDAGRYGVKVSKQASGVSLFSIQDSKTDKVQQVLLNVNGDAASSELRLLFTTIGDRKFLSKLQTPSHAFTLVTSKAVKDARAKSGVVTTSISGGANLF